MRLHTGTTRNAGLNESTYQAAYQSCQRLCHGASGFVHEKGGFVGESLLRLTQYNTHPQHAPQRLLVPSQQPPPPPSPLPPGHPLSSGNPGLRQGTHMQGRSLACKRLLELPMPRRRAAGSPTHCKPSRRRPEEAWRGRVCRRPLQPPSIPGEQCEERRWGLRVESFTTARSWWSGLFWSRIVLYRLCVSSCPERCCCFYTHIVHYSYTVTVTHPARFQSISAAGTRHPLCPRDPRSRQCPSSRASHQS